MSAWFKSNVLLANSGKSHFLVSPYEKISLKILGSTVESSPCEELLGITTDSEVTFHKHILSLCFKANQKLNALARIAKYLTTELLERDNFFTIHERNIQYVAIEAYEVKNGLSPVFQFCFWA